MRIIAGQRRGHKIDGPAGNQTRPTSDRVRESIFNILGPEVDGRIVFDLFAGTGALGLEALSRDADRAVFVERERENVGLIRRNIATLRFEDRSLVLPTDAYRWARSFEPPPDLPVLVLIDPPYREFEARPRRVRELLETLQAHLPAGSIIVLEAGGPLDAEVLPDPEAWDVRKYGTTRVGFRTIAATEPQTGPCLVESEAPEP